MLRASWLSAASYRLNLLFSLASLLASVVPIYFVAHAMQPLMGPAIRAEGEQYFGFVLVGMITLSLVATAVNTLPGSIGSGIANGTFEALLVTPSSMPALLTGMIAYGFAWTALRGGLLLLAGAVLGAQIAWSGLPFGIVILLLIVCAHVPFGLMAAALILFFRTSGPLPKAVLIVSGLLGGVYYPTHVIPSWIQHLSAAVPLTYGLRALRRTLLEGWPPSAVAADVATLIVMAVVLMALGCALFVSALRYARRAGTLAFA